MSYTNDDRVKVIKALENPKYKWRTVRGVAQESGLPEQRVGEIVSRTKGLVVQSSVPSTDGLPLYTTRRHLREKGTTVERLFGAFKNRAI